MPERAREWRPSSSGFWNQERACHASADPAMASVANKLTNNSLLEPGAITSKGSEIAARIGSRCIAPTAPLKIPSAAAARPPLERLFVIRSRRVCAVVDEAVVPRSRPMKLGGARAPT